jgi:tRNA (guanine-N7-)-methyltransferase
LNREIRSYVLRQGRITPSQQRALEELLPRFGISFSEEFLNAKEIFGRSAPVVFEIGSGMGETTAAIAQAHPGTDYLAIEVHGPGVGSLLNRIDALALTNLRVIRHDAVEVLERMIPDGALAGIHLFFPDPWPKKRHHKRRLVQASFAALAASRLAPGGVLHLATDWQPYALEMLAVLGATSGLDNLAGDGFVARPSWRAPTRFESRGERLGHEVWDLAFRRAA